MQIQSPVLSVQNLSLAYAKTTVLHDIYLDLPPSSVVGLIGRNGAGKSSLMRCMIGLSVPQSGSVKLWDDDALTLSDATRARIGYVPQQAELVQWMTVWEHIEYVGSFYPRWQEGRARALCTQLDLALDITVKNLSVGDQQKLSIVLALAHDPDLVLMDEPVASLDPFTRRDFMRMLLDRDEPRTVLLSSHLLSDLERVVSHVAFMREGRLQLMSSWDDLTENLRLLTVTDPLLPQPGLLTQRVLDGRWRAVVDTRTAALSNFAQVGQPPLLEELFIELNK